MCKSSLTGVSLRCIRVIHFQNQCGTAWTTLSVLVVGLNDRRFRISTSTSILLLKCLLAQTSFVDCYLLLTPDTVLVDKEHCVRMRHPAIARNSDRDTL